MRKRLFAVVWSLVLLSSLPVFSVKGTDETITDSEAKELVKNAYNYDLLFHYKGNENAEENRQLAESVYTNELADVAWRYRMISNCSDWQIDIDNIIIIKNKNENNPDNKNAALLDQYRDNPDGTVSFVDGNRDYYLQKYWYLYLPLVDISQELGVNIKKKIIEIQNYSNFTFDSLMAESDDVVIDWGNRSSEKAEGRIIALKSEWDYCTFNYIYIPVTFTKTDNGWRIDKGLFSELTIYGSDIYSADDYNSLIFEAFSSVPVYYWEELYPDWLISPEYTQYVWNNQAEDLLQYVKINRNQCFTSSEIYTMSAIEEGGRVIHKEDMVVMKERESGKLVFLSVISDRIENSDKMEITGGSFYELIHGGTQIQAYEYKAPDFGGFSAQKTSRVFYSSVPTGDKFYLALLAYSISATISIAIFISWLHGKKYMK